jgi:hypothetical protein
MQDELAMEGWWRLTSVGDYQPAQLDAERRAFIEFSGGGEGAFHFAYVRGSMEYRATDRDGALTIEFSFDAHDGAAPLCGTGWAVLAEGRLEGTFTLHTDEQLGFRARRDSI